MTTPLIQLDGLTQAYGSLVALNGLTGMIPPSSVGLVGANGAGKSTLMKVLAGVQRPDSGQILLRGRPVEIASVQDAIAGGISLIHQELNLADNLTVGANIFLGREPRRLGLIDNRRIETEARDVLARIGLDVDPRRPLKELTIGRQQLVEIAKALSVNSRILIMDEPTSSLSSHETRRLFEVVKDLRAKGVSVIYISHRLGEVSVLADRVAVLRDGENAGELGREEISRERMVKLMVGRNVSQFYARRQHAIGDAALEVQDLITPAWPRHALNFTVRRGELVGVAGLVGAGRTELLRTLFGIDHALRGAIRIAGRTAAIRSPRDAIRAGMALVPEDRKSHGLVLELTVRGNIGLAGLQQNRRPLGFVNERAQAEDTSRMIASLGIKTPSPDQVVRYLSGGNQQKVVLGKWLALAPRILLLDEPTRGIDVGAKEEIYRLMEQLAEQGVAVLFVSSEMEEILGMSDRVLVMHEGRITGELSRDRLSEEAVMRLATGSAPAA
jgi:ribose transport system ATP-binding protein